MQTILFSILVPVIFLGVVIMGWLSIQLLANRRLGERKQGCKGPVPGENGEMLCCKGDGTPCKEIRQKTGI